jgi:2-polyprenyl-6-methoxyphenol hydroxylase-like FAD-dependent oxidoreductase
MGNGGGGLGLNVAVVGAGIGGLAAAAALLRAGVEVTVYEQAAAFSRVGAGIQMTPNPMKVLRGLGLEARLSERAFEPASALNRDHDTGQISNELPVAGVMQARYGAPFLFLHRGDLHAALAEAIPAERVHRGKRLTRIEQDAAGVALFFEDGTRARADALIGADGVHSVVRECLFGAESPRFTGRVAYRATFPAALLPGEPMYPARTKWWGPDRHVVMYYTTRERDEIYFTTSQPESVEWMTPESWSAEGDLAALREAFRDFHPEVRAVMQACPRVFKWALLARDPLPHWTRARVSLLGDACHPMPPYMAQGAAQAIEDAAVLARCLEGATAQTVGAALARYEATRKPRATEIQTSSGKNDWMRRQTDPQWVYGYDAWTAPLAPVAGL